MNKQKIYTAIATVYSICYVYSLFWFFKSAINFFDYGFDIFFIIRYIPVFAGITGLIIFIQSKFKRSNLLRMIMCLEVINFPIIIFCYFQFFTNTYGPYNKPPELNWTFYAGCVINISLFVSSIVGLRWLSYNKTANLTYIDDGNERVAQFSPATAGKRFANRLLDLIVIFYVMFNQLTSFNFFFKGISDFESEFIILLEIPFILFYYLIMEGFFNTTAGKCATNTTIVNESGERPRFTQILGRTFCRLIPFEPFSFFGAAARGWHDTMTNTYVVDSVNKEDQELDEFFLDAELLNQS